MTDPRRWIAGGALMLALVVSPLAAQRLPMRAGPGAQRNRQELEQRIRARFAQMIKQRLGLDDETASALDSTVQAFRPEREQLARDQEALRKRVQAFNIEGNGSDPEAQQLLDRMSELRQRENQLYQSEQDSLRKVLSPSQLLRFNLMRDQLAQRIQQLRMGGMMGGGRGLRGRGGGDGGGGIPQALGGGLPGLDPPLWGWSGMP
ncbi:MAG: Spy/CpxP family protein refolding chaperone [Gemmatimonadetes bacterium]|nr:Spy/CpxP family protein refolding chaperone [Gemmatimonadota bacterium]